MPASKDRVTVVLRVTHQRFNAQPRGVEFAYSRTLGLDGDEGWLRDAKVSEDWKALDLGWCADHKIAYIVIANVMEDRKVKRPAPLPEEEGSTDNWLELRYEDSKHCFHLPPNEALPILPSDAAALRIRVRVGSKKYRIFAIPEPE